jgi:hypothetical protein
LAVGVVRDDDEEENPVTKGDTVDASPITKEEEVDKATSELDV